MDFELVNRRRFLGKSAAAGLVFAGIAPAIGKAALGASDTIRVAIVGAGARGTVLTKECIQFGKEYNARVVGVCDIWNRHRDQAVALLHDTYGTEPKVYRRIEDTLEDKEVDAVIIATADHQHGQMLKTAVEAGKDVYCEKPLANVLAEANAALDAAKKTDRVVQIGTQRRSWPRYREAKRLMREGVLGDVVKVDNISNYCSPYRWARRDEDFSTIKEKDLDWPAFLLGKPYRPFDPRIFRCFRLFKDFSSGIIDQWMTHGIDAIQWLIDEPYPKSVVAQGGIYRYHDFRENPDTTQVLLEYGEGEKRLLVNYSVSLISAHGRAVRLLGTRGTLELEFVYRLSGDGITDDDRIPEAKEIPEAPNTFHHMANWLDCIRRRDPKGAYADIDAGYAHSIACIMSNEALWNGGRLSWDPSTRSIG